MSIAFLISTFLFILLISLVHPGKKGMVAVTGIFINAAMSSWIAVAALSGNPSSQVLDGGPVFGEIALRLDGVSAWFILVTNFTMLTGILYGRQYLRHHPAGSAEMSLHYISYLLNHAALTGIYLIQNMLAFLCTWEIMALTAFVLVIFEHSRMETLKAGINYLIQSHISIILLTLGFIWVYTSIGSFDFEAIRTYCLSAGHEAALLLFLVFFVGFGIKAGFVPFHTWLPRAHPAAPSHVSGIMSGILIKAGVYGILRILLLMPENHLAMGYFILAVSVITGLYGVILAIVQHNIKKLLAYHSIENIGIIGIGMGIGTIGVGLGSPFMAFAGYAGAMLHVLNHALFKSLLFYSAGNVYNALHTLVIDRMGGLIRNMPRTALFFLIASLAICGLPPFNGFISEFLIYSGLLNAIGSSHTASVIILAVIALALIGGLALLCFTKAFGTIFLGTARQTHHTEIREENNATLFPMALTAALIIAIGLLPQLFISILRQPVELFMTMPDQGIMQLPARIMQQISISVWGLVLLIAVLWLLRKAIASRQVAVGPTWGCGYSTESPKLQYTASSFVRSYAKIIKPLTITKKSKDEVLEIVPGPLHTETHFHDKLESGLVDWPTRNLRGFLGRFKFLQNGSVQFYVLYGVVFIAISIAVPLIIDAVRNLAHILKHL
ncbi:MAG: proton-conducting transporter membrane subunit [Bacteroidales bacterium]